jgi:hypothetical protein
MLFPFALALFVLDLAVVADPADRRLRLGRDFDQVQPLLLSKRQSVAHTQDTERLAVLVN